MGKSVRQNSKDILAARQLAADVRYGCKDARMVFVEVPIGSQSARAMASYGICVGVLGALAVDQAFIEVTPTEVKLASVGSKTASKQEMIDWAVNNHPDANWPLYRKAGELQMVKSSAEHMADAIASIYAGVQTTQFMQLLNFFNYT